MALISELRSTQEGQTMPTVQEIRDALRASRVVPLGVSNPHGPLGLEHLASAVDAVARSGGESLSITLRPQTREKLERLAQTQGGGTSHPMTAADVAA